jgi:WD40 repeat protein
MAATVQIPGPSTRVIAGRTPKRRRVGHLIVACAVLALLPAASQLARLAAAIPKALGIAGSKPETAPAPKAAVSKSTHLRGEPLLFETSSTELRPGADNWWSVSLSPDGKWIATGQGGRGNAKGEVKIWERESGTIKQVIEEPKGVRSVAFSPDGKVLATGNYDSIVRFYDASTFKLFGRSDPASNGHKSGVNGLCFFKNGQYLASAGLDNTSRLWDVSAILTRSKKSGPEVVAPPVAVFEGHTQGVLSVSVSGDGSTLLSGSFDRTARCYDVPNPLPAMGDPPVVVKKERVVLQGHSNTVEAVAVSPDGQTLVTGSWDAQLFIRDRDGTIESTLRFGAGVMCVAFSKDGKHLAAGSGNAGNPAQPGQIRVWDMEAKKEAAFRGDYPSGVLGIAFAPDGKTVVSTGADQAVHLWPFAEKDRKTFTPPGLKFNPEPYLAGALSPSGEFLAISGDGKSAFILNRKDNKLVAELTGHEDVIAALAFSPDGNTLATASFDKTIKLWNTKTWKERKTLSGHTGWVLGVEFAPDSHILATGSYDKTVRLWNAETGEPKATWKNHSAGVRSVAFSPDGKRLVSGGSDRVLRVWNVADGAVLHSLKGHKSMIRSVAFAADNKTVASGAEDKVVKIWNADSGQETISFATLPEMVTAVRFSPKGQSLAVGTFQGTIAMLDPITGRTRQMLRAHGDAVTALSFTDGGQNLISVSQDRTIRQWPAVKPSTVAPVQTLAANLGVISAAAVTPNGVAAVLGNTDGQIVIWELKTGDVRPFASTQPGGVSQLAASNELFAAIGKEGSLTVAGFDLQPRWKGKGKFAAFMPDGKRLGVAEGKDIVLYEAATGKELKRFAGGTDGEVHRFAFSPDGKRLISAGEETKVRLWNVDSGAKMQETPAFGNYSSVTQLAFAPDGSKFAAAAYGPEQAPPEDMTGNFRPIREVRVFTIPSGEAAPFPAPVVFSPQPADQPITGLDWLASGQVLMMPAADGTVRLNQLPAGGPREMQRFRAHDSAILASAISLDGSVFITAGEDLVVRRWKLPGIDPAPGQARFTAPGLTRVWQMLPSPDGKYIVTAGEGDKTFRVYSHVPTALPVEPDRHGSAYSLCFSPDYKFVVSGHDKGAVVVRDAVTGKAIRTLTGLTKRVMAITFAEKGEALVAVSGNPMNGAEAGEAIAWDFVPGRIRHKFDAPQGQAAAVTHPNDKYVACAGGDGSVRIWDLLTGNLVKQFKNGGGIYAVAFDSKGERLLVGVNNHTVRIWDAVLEKVIKDIPTNKDLRQSFAVFSPDGKEIVVSSWRGNNAPADKKPEIAAYSIDNPKMPPRLFSGHTAAVSKIAFLPDGKTLIASGGEDKGQGSLRAYDFVTAKQLGMFTGHRNWAQSMAVSSSGKVASTSWATPMNGEIRLWDPRGLHPIAEVKVPGENMYVSCGAISKDGMLLVLGGWGRTITAWDMSNPARPVLKKQLKGHEVGLRHLAFDAAGTRFATSDESGMVKVWDAATLNLVVSFKASTRGVYRLRFTPDGTGLVTASGNYQSRAQGEIRIWDPVTGKETGRFPDQAREIWDMVFLNGGKQLAVIHVLTGAPGDSNIKIWDFERKEVVQSVLPSGTFSGGRCLGLSPDGKHLAIGSTTGPVKVLSTDSWQEELSIPDVTNTTFSVEFTRDGNNLLIASGEGAGICVRMPWAK